MRAHRRRRAVRSREPLACPKPHFREILSELAALEARSRLTHSVQTNGMLIDDGWCEIFRSTPVAVCVSIDGARATHDAYRKTRRGGGTLDATIAGIEALKRNGVPFSTLSVVTPTFLAHLRDNLELLAGLGASGIAFNVEELEGANALGGLDRTVSRAEMTAHWKVILRFALERGIFCREFWTMWAKTVRPGTPNIYGKPYTVLTVTARGDFGTHSPELSGNRTERYGDAVLGNVFATSLREAALGAAARRLAEDVKDGLVACESSCEYYEVCGGGSPSNKIFEHGRADATETGFCRMYQQSLCDAFLDLNDESPALCDGYVRSWLARELTQVSVRRCSLSP